MDPDRGRKEFVCLTYGTGVGGAIFAGGRLYSGCSYSAGEFGAVITHPEDRDIGSDMFSGCYEKYASVTALVKNAGGDGSKDNGMVTEWAARNKRVLQQLLGIQKRNAWQMLEGIVN